MIEMKMLSAVQTRLGWPDVVKHKIFNVSGYGRIYHIIERVFNFLLLIYISITKKRDRVLKQKKTKNVEEIVKEPIMPKNFQKKLSGA